MITSCYIHIPFCKKICAYCDFPKFCYFDKWIEPYLEALEEEIRKIYINEEMKTIYIGGGTPSSLDEKSLEKLFEILNIIKKAKNCEFTIEVNSEDITEEKVKLFKKYGINRVSIGVQTFNPKLQKILNRISDYEVVKKAIVLLNKYGIKNINLDLMYAIPEETLEDLKEDLDKFLSLNISHISTYSLILEEHTQLYLKQPKLIDEDLDFKMYNFIIETLAKNNYNHYEISNFSKEGYYSKHNLTYWNNEMYYGFGLGASSYIKTKRFNNHSNLTKYINKDFKKDEEDIGRERKMEYEMILGLRKVIGVSNKDFFEKYGKNIEGVFDLKKLLESKLLVWENEYLKIPEDKLYLSNEILVTFIF